MKILVACEFSGQVRDAFLKKGHDAISIDFIESETSGPHIIGDVRSVLDKDWDMLLAFPPCTYLCASGARWWKKRKKEQVDALNLVRCLLYAQFIPKRCLENPIGLISTAICKPTQIIQPWMFGHPETKATCLWLAGLPLLKPTNVVKGRNPRVHYERPSKNRWKNRSRTLSGIAKAMAEQWG